MSARNRIFAGLLAVILLVFPVAGPARAGADSRRVPVGDAAQLTAAVNAARPGDRIVIAPGRYRVKLRFRTGQSGTARAPIVLAPRDGPGTVVIDGTGTDMPIKFSGAAYIRVEGLDITGGRYHGVFFDFAAHHITIDGNRIYDNFTRLPMNSHAELKGSGGDGRPRYITIINNEIFHTKHPPGGNFQGIDCNFCDDFRIVGNYLHDIGAPTSFLASRYDRGSCIQMKSTSKNTVIEGNRIAHCNIGIVLGGEGLASPENLNGLLRNNLIIESAETGIAIINARGGRIVNNTLYGNTTSILVARDGRNPAAENTVAILNNLLGGPVHGEIAPGIALEGNLVLDAAAANRVFRDPAAGNFRLKATAGIAIDKGVDTSGDAPRDYAGTKRPQGAGVDIGAFEYSP